MSGRIIETEADLREGAAWLAAREPRFARALELTGPLPLRRRQGGFAALLRTICAQQLSVASADAVWNRLEAAGATVPANLLAMDDTACYHPNWESFALKRAEMPFRSRPALQPATYPHTN